MNPLRRVVEDHWRVLRARRTGEHELTVASLPVSTPLGDLAAGIDVAGRRHLLVPLGPDGLVEPDTRSAGVQLLPRVLEDGGDRQTYGDLVLLDESLADVFTSLCADVVAAVEMQPDRAVRAVRGVLDAWRALIDGARPTLGPNAAAGLFAELTVLARLLALDPGAVAVWTGPHGTAQDFHRGRAAVEVKSTTSPEGRRFRVHGLDQLDPGGGPLWVAWFRLERHPVHGTTLDELVERVRLAADDERAFVAALASTGYTRDDAYAASTRFSVVEERWYRVDPAFPRLVATSLVGGVQPAGVGDVHYTVDLDVVADWLPDGDDVLARFLGEI